MRMWVGLHQVSKPMCTYYFQGAQQPPEAQEKSQFICAVCWKGNSPVMLAANSHGSIKVLKLAM